MGFAFYSVNVFSVRVRKFSITFSVDKPNVAARRARRGKKWARVSGFHSENEVEMGARRGGKFFLDRRISEKCGVEEALRVEGESWEKGGGGERRAVGG